MTRIIILAAGKGTRMDSELPKVLVPLKERAMIKYLMDSVTAAAIDKRPLIIVSPTNKDIISNELREYSAEYVIQEEQLGTGHAVACARNLIDNEKLIDNIIVLYGDHPFLKAESISNFAAIKPEAVTVMPTVLPNFQGWYQNFYHWGRMVKGPGGNVERIVEFKDATEEEKLITEVNPGFMCFNREWLFRNIDNLDNQNMQKEYYLTDMVKIASKEGHPIGTINIEPYEAMGINSLEELRVAEEVLSKHI